MATHSEAIEILQNGGYVAEAAHVANWRNRDGQAGGWDGNFRKTFPELIPLLWPEDGLAHRFVAALRSAVLEEKHRHLRDTFGASAWTEGTFTLLADVATRLEMHACAARGTLGPEHMRREFLFDVSVYAKEDWGNKWGLPKILIEHENSHSKAPFFDDFWKLMVGNAPLRVMFGYGANAASIEERVTMVREQSQINRWTYPRGTEDLVLLRYPGDAWPNWRILHRACSSTWSDFKSP
jgi:hypothetical protein